MQEVSDELITPLIELIRAQNHVIFVVSAHDYLSICSTPHGWTATFPSEECISSAKLDESASSAEEFPESGAFHFHHSQKGRLWINII